MKLLTYTLLLSALAIAGCNTSESTNEITDLPGPVAEDPMVGAISLGSAPAQILESLPDIEFDGITESFDREESDAADLTFDDGTAAASPSVGSTDAGSTDGGSDGSDTGRLPGSTGSSLAGESASVDAVSTGTISTDSGADTAAITSDSFIPEQQQFRAGTLTAGDYDDQLNPHLYQNYASDFLQRVGGRLDVPYLDLSKRIAVHVRDIAGNDYGGVKIVISDDNSELLTLTTTASGRTYLYSDVDNLPEQFTIQATGLFGTAIDASLKLSDAQASGIININLPEEESPAAATRPATLLDVMFVVDTTGSMGDELAFLQTELTPIINAIPYDQSLLNLGLTFYRDIGDEYVVRSHEFTNDIGRAQQALNNETFDGGGDYPEAMDQALHEAVNANWQPDSRRILFLIADAPPHSDRMRATWDAAVQARESNIHIVPIAASGVGENAEYIMRSIAAYTNSRYLFLTDDSGFGNPHAEPDVDCYVVTLLDNLMVRVMNSLINGERDEPTENDIIRQVGDYDRGVCNTGQTGQADQ